MQCPHCKQEHPEGLQVCPLTGNKIIIPQSCPQCGKPIDANWLHCGYCGQKLVQAEKESNQKEIQEEGFPPEPKPVTGYPKILRLVIFGGIGGLLIIAFILVGAIWSNKNDRDTVLPANIVFTTAIALSADNAPVIEQFIIKDLVPSVNFNEITQSRFLVMTNQEGQLESEVRLPSHRQEMVLGNSRITLGEGKASFAPPPQSQEQQAPSPGFTAGIITPDWFSGAEHIIIGKITLNNYVFDSDPSYPLTFKVVKDIGYVYVCGRGTVTTPQGKTQILGKSDTISYWIELASSSNQLDREGAAQALGYIAVEGSENERLSAIEKLLELLGDKSFEVRRDSIEALAQIGAVNAVPLLREIAEKDENEWVRNLAKWAFEKIEGGSD